MEKISYDQIERVLRSLDIRERNNRHQIKHWVRRQQSNYDFKLTRSSYEELEELIKKVSITADIEKGRYK
jgi:hypothetical protein